MILLPCSCCGLPSVGEVVLWRHEERQPLCVAVCDVHRRQVVEWLTDLVTRSRAHA